MGRPECSGVKDDGSDQCDFYDPYPCHDVCSKYDNEFVECITYCTHRKIKGVQINGPMNPLHMERIPRWNEVIFNGEVKTRSHDFYNSSGIVCYHDGTMYDPVSKLMILKNGTVLQPGERNAEIDNLCKLRYPGNDEKSKFRRFQELFGLVEFNNHDEERYQNWKTKIEKEIANMNKKCNKPEGVGNCPDPECKTPCHHRIEKNG